MGSTWRDGATFEGANAGSCTSWLGYFGEELRLARERQELSVRQLAAHTSYSYQQLGNVEAARRTPSEHLANEVDRALETGGRFARILSRVLAESMPGWFEGLAQEEARATRIRSFQCQAVAGLLQTEAYARAQIRAGRPGDPSERIEELVAYRMARQAVLGSQLPPHLWVILDEGILYRAVGGPPVMVEQLKRLLVESENPRISVQILPFSAGAHAATDGSFVLWSYADRPDALYLEGMYCANIVERSAELDAARLVYDHLQAAALPREQSADLIREAMNHHATA